MHQGGNKMDQTDKIEILTRALKNIVDPVEYFKKTWPTKTFLIPNLAVRTGNDQCVLKQFAKEALKEIGEL